MPAKLLARPSLEPLHPTSDKQHTQKDSEGLGVEPYGRVDAHNLKFNN